jgi:polar amino acid transport system substrate-binding protein
MQAQRIEAPRPRLTFRALATAVFCLALTALPAAAQTVDRVKAAGHINLGYLADARPFTSRGAGGAPEGYAATLCQQVVDRLKSRMASAQLAVQWVPVTVDNRLREVQQGNVDLLCTPMSVTVARRQDVSFSIPVFAAGNRAVVRAETAQALRDALADNPGPHPVWRGSPAAKVLGKTKFAAVTGTTTASWLDGRRTSLQVDATIVPVPDYRTGLQKLLAGDVDVLFGERTVVLSAMDESTRGKVVVLDRLFTHESAALALAKGDDDFRALVDAALSEIYASNGFQELYTKWFGAFDDSTRTFFEWSALPQQ